jgi:hypothetical protein
MVWRSVTNPASAQAIVILEGMPDAAGPVVLVSGVQGRRRPAPNATTISLLRFAGPSNQPRVDSCASS